MDSFKANGEHSALADVVAYPERAALVAWLLKPRSGLDNSRLPRLSLVNDGL